MIEFLCPEGHKIRCPKENAGRPAKCPKCGVGFRIPTIEELGLGEPAVANASLAGEEVTNEPAAPRSPGDSGKQATATVTSSKERQIEFLCPNGHHLHGPASLQGRAGECPECGSRFRIPIIDEPEAEAPCRLEVPAEPEVAVEEETSLDSPTPLAGPSRSIRWNRSISCRSWRAVAGRPRTPAVPSVHPLAALFIELWAARGEGSRVEVHLESGSVLLPDGYLKPHSRQNYAVLVTKAPTASRPLPWCPGNRSQKSSCGRFGKCREKWCERQPRRAIPSAATRPSGTTRHTDPQHHGNQSIRRSRHVCS